MKEKNNISTKTTTEITEDKKALDPIEVVNLYYNMYKEYEAAYTNRDAKSLNEELKELVIKGESGEAFKNIAKEYIKVTSSYSNEVAFASNKFLNAADFYLKTNIEDLPSDISKDYVLLKSNEYKPQYSVKKGAFVPNSKINERKIPDQEYEYLFDYFTRVFSSKD